MPISRSSLDSISLSFATVSVGTPEDPLEEKLQHISAAGFQAIELGFPDLLSFASKHHNQKIQENDYAALCSAGEEIKQLCKKYNLGILMLQPFSNFEGWAEGSNERDDAFERAKGWIEIMHAVGTDMLQVRLLPSPLPSHSHTNIPSQVGSTDSPNITTHLPTLADDLAALADLLAPHSYRLAYENWCWATAAPTWSLAYEIVTLADRPNIGLCLDTFQTVGSEYADPTTKSGLIEDTGIQQQLENNFRSSLARLASTVPKEKIYLLQISDAYKPPTPLEKGEVGGLRARGRWSHDFRPYLWNGGYLSSQCVEIARAVLGTGTRCWFSVEVFDGGMNGKGGMKQYDKGSFCKGAMESTRRLLAECADEK